MLRYVLIWGQAFTCLSKKKRKLSTFYIQNTWKIVRRWHHHLTHLHIHIDCSRNVLKITKILNFISSLFLSNLHQIFTVLFEMFYSFYWINWNLDQISPLSNLARYRHLRTRRALLLYKVYGNNALLALNWRYCEFCSSSVGFIPLIRHLPLATVFKTSCRLFMFHIKWKYNEIKQIVHHSVYVLGRF